MDEVDQFVFVMIPDTVPSGLCFVLIESTREQVLHAEIKIFFFLQDYEKENISVLLII